MYHCVPAWRLWRHKDQTPMMHLFSLFCFVKAACSFVCLSRSSRLVASAARSRSFLPLLLQTSVVLSLKSSTLVGHCCPLFFLLLSIICCLNSWYQTRHHLFILPLPLAPLLINMKHLPVIVLVFFSFSLVTPLLFSSLSTFTFIICKLTVFCFPLFMRAFVDMIVHVFPSFPYLKLHIRHSHSLQLIPILHIRLTLHLSPSHHFLKKLLFLFRQTPQLKTFCPSQWFVFLTFVTYSMKTNKPKMYYQFNCLVSAEIANKWIKMFSLFHFNLKNVCYFLSPSIFFLFLCVPLL